MSEEMLIALIAALLHAADGVRGMLWIASGDTQPRTYSFDTPERSVERARALLSDVRRTA